MFINIKRIIKLLLSIKDVNIASANKMLEERRCLDISLKNRNGELL